MQDHIRIADRLNLAAGRACRISQLCANDAQRTAFAARLVFQHGKQTGVRMSVVAFNDAVRRIAVDDLVLKGTPSGCRQMPEAMPDPVQIDSKPAIMTG